MDVICLCATARTKTTTALIHFPSACLSLFLSIKPTRCLVFPPLHSIRPGFILLTASCSLFFSPPRHPPHPCPFTMTVFPLYAYSNKGFMYCHNMINAVFAKGNYCQQKGRATHEVITTDHRLQLRLCH